MLQLVGAAGNTVLHMAAATGAVDTIRLLLRRGNNVHAVNKAGEVRLQRARSCRGPLCRTVD